VTRNDWEDVADQKDVADQEDVAEEDVGDRE
jgi:hypothetical protein